MYGFLGALAFVVWGLVPIYFHELGPHEPLLILAHRVFWSALILVIIGCVKAEWIPSKKELTRKSIGLAALSGFFMNISWCGFVYASVSDNLMAASLAFYITPIFVFTIGYVFFKEKVKLNQIISLVLMVSAVAIYAFSDGHFPVLSLFIALSFAVYIALKKMMNTGTFGSLLLEHILYMPFALFYIVMHSQNLGFNFDLLTLAGTAPLQLIPVLLVTISLLKTSLSKMSLLQYIEPTLHLLLAMWFFHDPVSNGQKYALSIIFVSILISSFKRGSFNHAHH
ncbi:chloramphenicol-sensitive protein RarD [Vibrio inusitatus NBRC 102082]|uniref:Chloramphenicol-sensitive protein RarD n=1 Tax=Vibrio inusitatus NBRC 102082 TaxID=1219070 RepID=A0A4Y3HUR2_9VIBR|nr:EamA family transporter [Vibrio inusitatus]GEA50903.1 chloramphenicol-sensitive protein RarD [Vibrio inusitatus NBRC 102082]